MSSSISSPPTSPVSVATAKTFERRVQFLALGFLILFLAYSSAQLLQTPLNKTLGYACLLSLYACFGMAALGAPSLVDRFGPRKLLAASAVGYVVMVAANLNPLPGLLLPGCLIVGICAATLWSSQGTYIGGCAVQLAARTGRPLTECTSQLNASFYSIFMVSGGVSSIFASLILMSFTDAVRILFLVLTAVGIVGVVALSSLPESADASRKIVAKPWFLLPGAFARGAGRGWSSLDAPPSSSSSSSTDFSPSSLSSSSATTTTSEATAETSPAEIKVDAKSSSHPSTAITTTPSVSPPLPPPQRPSLRFMLHFLTTNRRMRFIIPIMIMTGATNGFISGAFYGGVVGRTLGIEYVGFTGSLYSFNAAFSTRIWGYLAQKKKIGRRWCFAVAVASHLLWFAIFAPWITLNVDSLPETEGGIDGKPELLPEGPERDMAFTMLFVGIFWFSFFDPVFNSFVPATLQTFFSTGPEAPCAMASIRAMYSLGFSTQQGVSIALSRRHVGTQAAVIFVLLVGSGISLWYLHRYISPIDSVAAVTTTDATAKSFESAIVSNNASQDANNASSSSRWDDDEEKGTKGNADGGKLSSSSSSTTTATTTTTTSQKMNNSMNNSSSTGSHDTVSTASSTGIFHPRTSSAMSLSSRPSPKLTSTSITAPTMNGAHNNNGPSPTTSAESGLKGNTRRKSDADEWR